jgi:hypothetical protein
MVNGKPFPAPKRYPNMVVTTAVNAARNANNKIVGQKIGRDNYKIANLEWPYLDAETWSSMLKEFKKYFVTVRFWDMVENNWITLTMYPGDRTADVFKYDKTGRPVAYINCKVNIIDAGW